MESLNKKQKESVRLYEIEKKALYNAISNIKGEVYLFGSRVDDTKKGGDIDILIFTKDKAFDTSHNVAVKFFMECEEKIDVIVMNPEKLTKEQKAFFNVIEKIRIQ